MYWGMQYLTIICLLYIFLMTQEGEVVILFSCDKECKGNRNQSTQTRESTMFSCCSVTKSFPTLCDPIDCSVPGCSVLFCLLEFAQISLNCFPSTRVFSSDLALHIRRPKYWSFSFSICPSNEYSGLISFRNDWLDLLAV